jgi:hypothetical protein
MNLNLILISLFLIPIYYVLIEVYPNLVLLGTGFSGWAKAGMIPSTYPISKSIPSGGEVVNCTFKFYPSWSGHVANIAYLYWLTYWKELPLPTSLYCKT